MRKALYLLFFIPMTGCMESEYERCVDRIYKDYQYTLVYHNREYQNCRLQRTKTFEMCKLELDRMTQIALYDRDVAVNICYVEKK